MPRQSFDVRARIKVVSAAAGRTYATQMWLAKARSTEHRFVVTSRPNMAGMANAGSRGAHALTYFLGKCMPCHKRNATRIRIKQLELDKNLCMYFPTYKFVFAHDPEKSCKTGDTVLIQTLPEKLTTLLTHKVVKVVYPLGDVTDPVTGKKVVVGKFREDVKMINQMYGESTEAFDYDKEPPRGKTRGKRDFSHKTGVIKFHDDPDRDIPHAI